MKNRDEVERLQRKVKELEEELASRRKECEMALNCLGSHEFMKALDNDEFEFYIAFIQDYGYCFITEGDYREVESIKVEGVEFLFSYENVYCGTQWFDAYWMTPINMKSIKFFNSYNINVRIAEEMNELFKLADFITDKEEVDSGLIELTLGKDI